MRQNRTGDCLPKLIPSTGTFYGAKAQRTHQKAMGFEHRVIEFPVEPGSVTAILLLPLLSKKSCRDRGRLLMTLAYKNIKPTVSVLT